MVRCLGFTIDCFMPGREEKRVGGRKYRKTRCWHVTISCQPDGRPLQPVRPWKSERVHLAEGSNVVVLELTYSTEFECGRAAI